MLTATVVELKGKHAIISNTLEGLPNKEKILGTELMKIAGIKNRSYLRKIIQDLRKMGMPIGANNNGYFEMRTNRELYSYLIMKREMLQFQLDLLTHIEMVWAYTNPIAKNWWDEEEPEEEPVKKNA